MKIEKIFLISLGLLFLLWPSYVLAAGDGEEKSFLADSSFFELWNPILLMGVALVFWAYLHAIKKHQSKGDHAESPVSMVRKVSFLCGLILFFIASGTPLHALGDDYVFSVHMLNQSLIYIVMPPLLLIGLEKWMMEPIVKIGLKLKILTIVKYPLVCLFLFNILISFYHIPVIFDFFTLNPINHNISHWILPIAALLMWIPIIPVMDEAYELSPLQKLGYLVGAGLLLTPATMMIIFAKQPMYALYASSPEFSFFWDPRVDQQTGGIIIKVIQEVVYVFTLGYIFFKWAKQEQATDEYIPTSYKS